MSFNNPTTCEIIHISNKKNPIVTHTKYLGVTIDEHYPLMNIFAEFPIKLTQ